MVWDVSYAPEAYAMLKKLVRKLQNYATEARRVYMFELRSISRRLGGALEAPWRESGGAVERLGELLARLTGVLKSKDGRIG